MASIAGLPYLTTMLIVMMACPIVATAVMTQFPFIDNLTITPVDVSKNGKEITVSVTCDVYFTEEAWSTFRYKDGSFPYMSDWWEQHEGKKFSFMGYTAKLVDVDFTLLEHTSEYDRIKAVVTLKL
ncbi:MAG: hypothetical protein GX648_03180 [Crenarchaeota archaeon]|nr:hypothetical protein [Thermoproteota archaeon]